MINVSEDPFADNFPCFVKPDKNPVDCYGSDRRFGAEFSGYSEGY